jgi:pyrroline-5-carboxylate reductase
MHLQIREGRPKKMGKGKLGVIGAGVMGKTLIQGLLQKGVYKPKDIWASARTESSCLAVESQMGIKAFTQYSKVLPDTDVLLLCVKPAQVNRVLEQLQRNGLKENTLVISIVAGTSIEQMESGLHPKSPVIRAMTNTPCVVSQGMTVICGGTHAEKSHLNLAQEIFESVGICLSLEEQHFDAITGLSGSGPAYLYLIMEALADGGVRVGLPRDVALKVVSQVVLGAATMVQQTGRHPAALRDDVTTPAGCTIGGLLIMEDGKIRSVLARAVEEATAIASQLGKK